MTESHQLNKTKPSHEVESSVTPNKVVQMGVGKPETPNNVLPQLLVDIIKH